MKQKLIDSLKSQQFLVAVIGTILMFLKANGVETEKTALDWYTLFTSSQGWDLLVTVIPAIVVVGFKVWTKIQEKVFSFSYFKDPNVLAALLSTLSIVVGALAGEALTGLIMGIIVQVLNMVFHLAIPTTVSQETTDAVDTEE